MWDIIVDVLALVGACTVFVLAVSLYNFMFRQRP